MGRYLRRALSLLLISSLIADPSLASLLQARVDVRVVPAACFTEEAFAVRALSALRLLTGTATSKAAMNRSVAPLAMTNRHGTMLPPFSAVGVQPSGSVQLTHIQI